MRSKDEAGAIAAAITGAHTIYLATHEYPDGDALGSLLGLRLALLALGKQVAVATPTAPPQRFEFLPGFEEVAVTLPPAPADLAIALDCDGISRLGGLQPAFASARRVADVDHHRREVAFGDLRFVQPEYPATAVMVLAIIDAADVTISADIASCLYTGLITDTGNFRFANTDAQALRVGARLVEAGADAAELARRTFSLRPIGVKLLTGRALTSLRPELGGAVLVATLSLDDFAATGTGPEDTDGLIDEFRDCPGVEVAVLIKQLEPSLWSVSLRSQQVNVATVAAAFGGGGHRVAAGCTVPGELAGVRQAVLDQIRAHLAPGVASHD